jgi:hypothetical protein
MKVFGVTEILFINASFFLTAKLKKKAFLQVV